MTLASRTTASQLAEILKTRLEIPKELEGHAQRAWGVEITSLMCKKDVLQGIGVNQQKPQSSSPRISIISPQNSHWRHTFSPNLSSANPSACLSHITHSRGQASPCILLSSYLQDAQVLDLSCAQSSILKTTVTCTSNNETQNNQQPTCHNRSIRRSQKRQPRRFKA